MSNEFQDKDASQIGIIMRLLSMTSSFSMALMFLDKPQKAACKELLGSLSKLDSVREIYSKLNSLYAL
jgi:hypothetical protein